MRHFGDAVSVLICSKVVPGMSYESLMKQIKDKERVLQLLEIDNAALRARCKVSYASAEGDTQ